MWSFGLAKYLNDHYSIGMKLGVITQRTDVSSFEELEGIEFDLYHVFLDWGSRGWFDATGGIDADYLLDFSLREYSDDDPDLYTAIELSEVSRRVISFNTSWSIDWVDFYRVLEGGSNG